MNPKKHILYFPFVFFLLANLTPAYAQQRDTLSGLWEGVLTIEKDDVILSEYNVFF